MVPGRRLCRRFCAERRDFERRGGRARGGAQDGIRCRPQPITQAGEIRDGTPPYRVTPVWELPSNRPKSRIRAFVDHQNDVTAKDLHLAVREGLWAAGRACQRRLYHDGEWAPIRARPCGINAIGVLSGVLRQADRRDRRHHLPPALEGRSASVPSPGNMSARCSIRAARRRCMTGTWANGAVFEIVGDWLRARGLSATGGGFRGGASARMPRGAQRHRCARCLHARQDSTYAARMARAFAQPHRTAMPG